MASVLTRERGNPIVRDDASVPAPEYELAPPEPAQREDAESFAPCLSNLDVDDHGKSLTAQFAGRQVKVTWVMRAPSVSNVQVV